MQSKSAACYMWSRFALENSQHMSEMILKKVALTHFTCTLCTERERRCGTKRLGNQLFVYIYEAAD